MPEPSAPTSPPPPTQPTKRPWWVWIAVFGYTSKAGVRLATWICLATALGFAVWGLKWKPAWGGFLVALLFAWWHDRALSWMNRNDAWPKK